MIYPKFPRRTLALILFCLVITLGAVGILFLIYFFNKNSALLMDSSVKTVYGGPRQSQQYKQNIIGNGNYIVEQRPTNRHVQDPVRTSDNTTIILQRVHEDLPILSSPSSQQFESRQGTQEQLIPKTFGYNTSKDSSTNVDTIYIDEFDRPTTNSKSNSGLSNIDYFDTILVDHKQENKNDETLNSLRFNKADSLRSVIYQKNFISESSVNNLNKPNVNERKLQMYKKRRNNGNRWNKTKLVRYTKLTNNPREDDDVYDLDTDIIGSGSGDFVDDTEINEIFVRKINTKMNKNENKSVTKNNRTRNKHRNYFFNKKLTTFPPLTSSVSRGGPSINWSTQKGSKRNILHATISPESTENIHSSLIRTGESFSEITSKNGPALAYITSHKKTIFYESDNNSANSQISSYKNNIQSQLEISEISSTPPPRVVESSVSNLRDIGGSENNEAWIETRTRRIMGNVKKSEERSRQLLLCEEAGGGELCRMLFKGHIND